MWYKVFSVLIAIIVLAWSVFGYVPRGFLDDVDSYVDDYHASFHVLSEYCTFSWNNLEAYDCDSRTDSLEREINAVMNDWNARVLTGKSKRERVLLQSSILKSISPFVLGYLPQLRTGKISEETVFVYEFVQYTLKNRILRDIQDLRDDGEHIDFCEITSDCNRELTLFGFIAD